MPELRFEPQGEPVRLADFIESVLSAAAMAQLRADRAGAELQADAEAAGLRAVRARICNLRFSLACLNAGPTRREGDQVLLFIDPRTLGSVESPQLSRIDFEVAVETNSRPVRPRDKG
jgi:hypothetical protein